jgi:hypothetical protein
MAGVRVPVTKSGALPKRREQKAKGRSKDRRSETSN